MLCHNICLILNRIKSNKHRTSKSKVELCSFGAKPPFTSSQPPFTSSHPPPTPTRTMSLLTHRNITADADDGSHAHAWHLCHARMQSNILRTGHPIFVCPQILAYTSQDQKDMYAQRGDDASCLATVVSAHMGNPAGATTAPGVPHEHHRIPGHMMKRLGRDVFLYILSSSLLYDSGSRNVASVLAKLKVRVRSTCS